MTVAVCWYTPESYRLMRAVADDRDAFAETFEEFEARAEKMVRAFAAEGFAVEKVVVDVAEVVRWCRRNGRRVDQAGRAAFGANLLCLRDATAEGTA